MKKYSLPLINIIICLLFLSGFESAIYRPFQDYYVFSNNLVHDINLQEKLAFFEHTYGRPIDAFSHFIFLLIFTPIYAWLLKFEEVNLFPQLKFNKMKLEIIPFILLLLFLLSINDCSYTLMAFDGLYSHSNDSLQNLICIIVLTPVFEELVFRGVCFNELKKCMSLKISLIIQALIFSSLHGNLSSLFCTFLFGLIAGIVYYFADSIFVSMLLHIGANFMAVFIYPWLLDGIQKSGLRLPLFILSFCGIWALLLIFIKRNKKRVPAIEKESSSVSY